MYSDDKGFKVMCGDTEEERMWESASNIYKRQRLCCQPGECAAVFNKQVGSSLINKEPGLSQPQPLLILIIYTQLGSLGQKMRKRLPTGNKMYL